MSIRSELPVIDRSVSLAYIAEFSERVSTLTEELRDQILAPRPRKNAPTFTTSEVAELCGLDRSKIHYLASREGTTLPTGAAYGTGRSRLFTLAETRTYIQQVSEIYQSPLVTGSRDADGRVVLVANFKGGSTKTTTSMCLAQGLTLRGRKVLVVDLDPQASLSELCGIYAEKEVDEDSTVLPYIYDQSIEGGLSSVIKSTYWDGLDVIPAHPSLFGAEFHLPAMMKVKPTFKFWAILRQGLEPLRKQYDYIILDTAPSLSYLTLNALMAADSMVMPLVPESLDFISSVSFWSLFSDIAANFMSMERDKKYDFISLLLSKVDYGQTSSAPIVRSWVQRAYGEWLNTVEVPASSVMSNGALALSTVFDISKADGVAKTVQRVRQPLMEYCRWLDDLYVEKWRLAQ
ncbi:cobyrinic acid a,c-diamide synthase [Caballeronia choica]|jgi:chromosome partitioning protein|uniref:Cobyrinic acid a,c-diamide synthase n=1 Tax=Caballeronia choica TaxID=326476 RepID=A0A158GWI6_9BURK|nr:AAA family ATPase [Caballeronia choica]SAL36402.1 cobyrinic acid a,c-diamide synthase [Caballeronia choica]